MSKLRHRLLILGLLLACTCLRGLPAFAASIPRLSISDVVVSEDGCAIQAATFTVSISTPLGRNVSVRFATADGTAVAGRDYQAVNGTLTFSRGSKAPQTITVPVSDVLVPAPNRAFYVVLTDPVNATLTRNQGTGTIEGPTVAKCRSCGVSCDDGNACTADVCDGTLGCRHANLSATDTAWCFLAAAGGGAFAACSASGEWNDTDGDGLSDAAEAQGYIDNDASGVYDPGIDLLLPGADPATPDVYLHYDYMDAGDHDHNPPAEAIQFMVAAFAAHGVNLHIDPNHHAICESAGVTGCIDAGTGGRVVTLANPSDPACTGPAAVSTAQLRQADTRLALLAPAYHYLVFGHYATCDPQVDPGTGQPYCNACPNDPENSACGAIAPSKPAPGNLGTAEIYGDEAIVATQSFADVGTPGIPLESWAGLAMHELGHNLGLEHGGPDCFNGKPNYLSVMNYNFYLQGIPVSASPGDNVPKACSGDIDCDTGDHPLTTQHCSAKTGACFRIDYSDRLFNSLDESGATAGIDEASGLQGGQGNTDVSWIVTAGRPLRVPTSGVPIDFNGDGNVQTNLIYDVNGDGQKTQLTTQNDWENLKFSYQCQPTFSAGRIAPQGIQATRPGAAAVDIGCDAARQAEGVCAPSRPSRRGARTAR